MSSRPLFTDVFLFSLLEECDGLKLKIDAHVIAGILEINKCQDVQVRVHTYVPTVQIDQSKRRHMRCLVQCNV